MHVAGMSLTKHQGRKDIAAAPGIDVLRETPLRFLAFSSASSSASTCIACGMPHHRRLGRSFQAVYKQEGVYKQV